VSYRGGKTHPPVAKIRMSMAPMNSLRVNPLCTWISWTVPQPPSWGWHGTVEDGEVTDQPEPTQNLTDESNRNQYRVGEATGPKLWPATERHREPEGAVPRRSERPG
jgi:hypothetical protein